MVYSVTVEESEKSLSAGLYAPLGEVIGWVPVVDMVIYSDCFVIYYKMLLDFRAETSIYITID